MTDGHMEVTATHRSSCLPLAPSSAPPMAPPSVPPPGASGQRRTGTSVSSPSSSPYTCCSRAELPPRLLPRHEVQLGRCSRSFSRAILGSSYGDTELPAVLYSRTTGANVSTTSSLLSPRARRSLATRLDRRRRHMPDSHDVLAAAAILPHLERTETALIARAAGCLDVRRPDHLGGVER